MKPKLTAVFILGQLASLAAAGAAIFLSAGRIDWLPGWGVVAVWVIWFAAEDINLRTNPALMAERLAPPKESKTWDKAILSSVRLLQLARYILAGLDVRYGWTSNFPPAAQVAALIFCLLGTGLFAWAMASNSFFSQVVRIQTERSHSVASGGPYRWVRHPAYLATILFDLALSTLLASWPAILLAGLCAVLFILRTALEDRTLQADLPGYADYARRVRYRVVPGIW